MICRELKLDYYTFSPSIWKKFIAGKSKPEKDQVKTWGVLNAKKIYIQDALWKKYKIRFPNHCISQKTGKPITFRYDISDAIGQLIYFACIVANVRISDIKCEVESPPDVEWGKRVRNIYHYS